MDGSGSQWKVCVDSWYQLFLYNGTISLLAVVYLLKCNMVLVFYYILTARNAFLFLTVHAKLRQLLFLGPVFFPPPEAGGRVGSGEPCGRVTPEEELLSQAVVVLSCASYRNQILHLFVRPALLASAIQSASSNQKRKRVCVRACLNQLEHSSFQPFRIFS